MYSTTLTATNRQTISLIVNFVSVFVVKTMAVDVKQNIFVYIFVYTLWLPHDITTTVYRVITNYCAPR